MLTAIIGGCGVGKTSLLAQQVDLIYRTEGRATLLKCRKEIADYNAQGYKLTPPDRVPIFTDFPVKINLGGGKFYEPYYLNGYRFGLPTSNFKTQFLPPFCKILLDEAQRYFDSRKFKSLPDWVSRAFEMHRHAGYDIVMALQRVMLLDKNIRDLVTRFIAVQSIKHEYNAFGILTRTIWTCREFDNFLDLDEYMTSGAKTYKETKFSYAGNIFNTYTSRSHAVDFLPPKTGGDFTYLTHGAPAKGFAEFYDVTEPKGYRQKAENNEEKI